LDIPPRGSETAEGARQLAGADIYFFPEMALTGYSIRDDIQGLAETLDGPSVRRVLELSRELGCGIVFGMPERDTAVRGHIFNSAVLTLPDGSVGVYRKCHPANFGPFDEKRYFASGRDLPVFPTPWGRIGLIICYDLFFPETVKAMALRGAELVVDISASPTTTRRFFEAVLPARAMEDTIFMGYSNLVGTEGQMQFWGGAQLFGPRGEQKAKGPYFEEAVVEAELDFTDIDVARPLRHTLRDTRPEILEELQRAARGE
jgi:predicted amidohydrolase